MYIWILHIKIVPFAAALILLPVFIFTPPASAILTLSQPSVGQLGTAARHQVLLRHGCTSPHRGLAPSLSRRARSIADLPSSADTAPRAPRHASGPWAPLWVRLAGMALVFMGLGLLRSRPFGIARAPAQSYSPSQIRMAGLGALEPDAQPRVLQLLGGRIWSWMMYWMFCACMK